MRPPLISGGIGNACAVEELCPRSFNEAAADQRRNSAPAMMNGAAGPVLQ